MRLATGTCELHLKKMPGKLDKYKEVQMRLDTYYYYLLSRKSRIVQFSNSFRCRLFRFLYQWKIVREGWWIASVWACCLQRKIYTQAQFQTCYFEMPAFDVLSWRWKSCSSMQWLRIIMRRTQAEALNLLIFQPKPILSCTATEASAESSQTAGLWCFWYWSHRLLCQRQVLLQTKSVSASLLPEVESRRWYTTGFKFHTLRS